MKFKILAALLLLVTISCKKVETNDFETVKTYYQALSDADYETINTLLKDSITTKELDYVTTYSKQDYIDFLKWDAVFKPTYEVLEIKNKNGVIKARISKACTRTLFLNEEPIITNEVVILKNGAINEVAITQYVVFNDDIWNKNRAELLEWTETNHPELNGFLHDQTESGAQKYLEAIDRFKNKN